MSGSASATLNGVPRDLIFSPSTRAYDVHLGDVVFENSVDVKSLQVKSFRIALRFNTRKFFYIESTLRSRRLEGTN